MVKNIVLVTNHLTPYRKFFYDRLYDACKLTGIKFTVLLMTKCEPKRNWDYDKLQTHYAILMPGHHFSFPINNHLNTSVISFLKKINPEIVVMAGSYFYYTNWLVLLYRNKLNYFTIFWSETHFLETRNYSQILLSIRDYFRYKFYSSCNGFWYSGSLSKKFISHYANKTAKLYFVPNLIDKDFYSNEACKLESQKIKLRQKWNITINDRVWIIPARLSPEKGILNFMDLLVKTKFKESNITIIIPGTGPLESNIKAKIADLGLKISLLGFHNQKEMAELYALSDVFVLPSLSDPNPLTCIEALWSGKPLLVSTHVGNYPEVIEEGVNGYVFDYSISSLSIEKINKIIEVSDEWICNAKTKSLEIAIQKYNPQKVVSRVINEMVNDIK